ncbi:GHMP kinase [Desulfitobacterium metallireducens]|uniref:GHMP kinase n=1 Tax=Desulfitobacterium metallireducens DSM 15288 TaxID=871968 RepID=W0E616_9FIRM|nr:GHMP kinase [Desulfitobacterium metallireducens]AHF06305.1 GHMP kinase [Desulfitobacterium metallireducens DSM 15288]
MSAYYGWARCPGTCGEWIQGAKNGTPFLIDCPVNRYVEVETRAVKHQERVDSGEGSEDGPEYIAFETRGRSPWQLSDQKTKTEKALTLLAKQFDFECRGKVNFHSELPVGKGMASSTADLSAVMAAVLTSLKTPWKPEDIAHIALAIEPSDPVMFPGVTEFAHQDGKYIRELGPNVPALLLVLDGGGTLDTQRFNARSDLNGHYRKYESLIQKALAIFYEGIAHGDLEKMAYASTISAQCNQEINPKPYDDEFTHFVQSIGGLGMISAHSGTILAGVFPPEISPVKKAEILENTRFRFNPVHLEWMETCDGGIQSAALEEKLNNLG